MEQILEAWKSHWFIEEGKFPNTRDLRVATSILKHTGFKPTEEVSAGEPSVHLQTIKELCEANESLTAQIKDLNKQFEEARKANQPASKPKEFKEPEGYMQIPIVVS